jgi:MlaA lipoprotein
MPELTARWGTRSQHPALLPTVWALLLSTFTMVGGCSTTRYYDVASSDSSELERVNRAVFAFNEDFDRQVVEPVAQQYISHVPNDLRKSIGGFIYNLNEFTRSTSCSKGRSTSRLRRPDGLSSIHLSGCSVSLTTPG